MCLLKPITVTILSLLLVTVVSAYAFAEAFIEAYGGVARTSNRDITVSVFNFPGPDLSATRSISFDDSVSVGLCLIMTCHLSNRCVERTSRKTLYF
ncbi:MAG: hypothetical protein ACLP9S_07410 [Syntrophales bacterium]|jgi:hypothetical protein